MLLIITSSMDGTADRIVSRFGGNIFRYNYDLWKEYTLVFDNDGWKITNPTGLEISSRSVTAAYWWKAFATWDPNDDKLVAAEVKYILRDMYGWCLDKGLVKGNSIDFHNSYGKLTINTLAKEFFQLPETMALINGENAASSLIEPVIVKSLSSATASNNQVLHTSEVSLGQIDFKYTWYLQGKIESDWDVTVFFCGGKTFAFKRSRKDLQGLDWRAEQDLYYTKQEWFPYELDPSIEVGIAKLSNRLGIDFGRYDFMIDHHGQLLFLELNANGQWVFLDIEDKYGLLDQVVSWLKG